jgi:hypothetical protein
LTGPSEFNTVEAELRTGHINSVVPLPLKQTFNITVDAMILDLSGVDRL